MGQTKAPYVEAHEAAVERYLEANPDADWEDAYEATCDEALIDMNDMIANQIDAARDRAKEQGL